jgi:hypothetical protein
MLTAANLGYIEMNSREDSTKSFTHLIQYRYWPKKDGVEGGYATGSYKTEGGEVNYTFLPVDKGFFDYYTPQEPADVTYNS